MVRSNFKLGLFAMGIFTGPVRKKAKVLVTKLVKSVKMEKKRLQLNQLDPLSTKYK